MFRKHRRKIYDQQTTISVRFSFRRKQLKNRAEPAGSEPRKRNNKRTFVSRLNTYVICHSLLDPSNLLVRARLGRGGTTSNLKLQRRRRLLSRRAVQIYRRNQSKQLVYRGKITNRYRARRPKRKSRYLTFYIHKRTRRLIRKLEIQLFTAEKQTRK